MKNTVDPDPRVVIPIPELCSLIPILFRPLIPDPIYLVTTLQVACSRLSVSEDDRKRERATSGISSERDRRLPAFSILHWQRAWNRLLCKQITLEHKRAQRSREKSLSWRLFTRLLPFLPFLLSHSRVWLKGETVRKNSLFVTFGRVALREGPHQV